MSIKSLHLESVGFPPKVPPRLTSMSAAKNTATFQKHHYSTQPGHSYQPPTTKPPPSPVSKHQEKIAGRAIPPVVKPKPLGYRTYDSLNDDEEQVSARLSQISLLNFFHYNLSYILTYNLAVSFTSSTEKGS